MVVVFYVRGVGNYDCFYIGVICVCGMGNWYGCCLVNWLYWCNYWFIFSWCVDGNWIWYFGNFYGVCGCIFIWCWGIVIWVIELRDG